MVRTKGGFLMSKLVLATKNGAIEFGNGFKETFKVMPIKMISVIIAGLVIGFMLPSLF
jgi:hypothetical protein